MRYAPKNTLPAELASWEDLYHKLAKAPRLVDNLLEAKTILWITKVPADQEQSTQHEIDVDYLKARVLDELQARAQRAHDLLIDSHKLDLNYPPDVLQISLECASVLCWILGHDHEAGTNFARNLDQVERAAAAKGYTLDKKV
jgi:hypothetical protein